MTFGGMLFWEYPHHCTFHLSGYLSYYAVFIICRLNRISTKKKADSMITSAQEATCRNRRYRGMILYSQRMNADLSGLSQPPTVGNLAWIHTTSFFQKVNCHNRVSFDRNQKIDASGMIIFFLKTLTKHGFG